MDRINHSSAVDIGGGRRGFRSKDTVAGIPGTVLTATHLNAEQEELMAVIEKSGLAGDSADLKQVARAIRSQAMNYRVAGGTANALTVALDPVPAAAGIGFPLRIYPSVGPNTGPVTVDDGSGVRPLRYVGGADLFPGEIVLGRVIEILCLGGVWVLLNPVEYFERLTPKRARQTSAFTPNVVLSDIGGVNNPNLTQSLTIAGVTYLDVTAYCAIRNTTSTIVGTIAFTRLARAGYPNVDSQYLGCQSVNNIQIPLSIRSIYRNLDPTATYSLQLLTLKDASVGPVGVLDAYLSTSSD